MTIKPLACLLALFAGSILHAQSVTASGDVSPVLNPNPGASWDTGVNNVVVGGTSTGSLTIASGGSVSVNDGAGTLTIARDENSRGTLNFGSADLDSPTTAGTLSVANIFLGDGVEAVISFNQTNALTISAEISQPNFHFDRAIYQRGTGTTTLSGNNANLWTDIKVNDGTFVIAGATQGRDMTVSGTNAATFRVTSGGALAAGDFYIANEGGGHLLIDEGGEATNNVATIGADNHTGTATVSGAGSSWTIDYNLHVGYGGAGTLTIADGGTVTVEGGAGTLNITENSDSIGTLNIGSADLADPTSGGTLNVASIVFGNGYGDVGTGSINFNQTDSFTLAAEISGNGTVNQRGTGTTTLTAANTYTGVTNILGGTLALRDGGSIANSSTVHVASGATLDAAGSFLTFGAAQILSGTGTLMGEIIVNGTLSVGDTADSAGILSFTNSLELTSTSSLLIELGGLDRGVSFDAINVTGDIAFDGTLMISLIDGFTLTEGDLFQIFQFGGHTRGDFANVVFASGGYTGSFNALDGALTISAIPEPSTYAAIAGGLVLGLTAWRRRAMRLRRLS